MRKKKTEIASPQKPKKICYIRGLSKGAVFVVAGASGQEYRFTFDKPCLEIGTEVNEHDVYGLLQKVKRELGKCGNCKDRKGGGKAEQVYQMFAVRD